MSLLLGTEDTPVDFPFLLTLALALVDSFLFVSGFFFEVGSVAFETTG